MILTTELNRSISAIEDRILRGLHHCHKTCCEIGGHHGRQTYIIWRWYHYRDVIFRWVDLHMTLRPNMRSTAKLLTFNGEMSKVSRFLIVYRLYIRIKIKNVLVKK